MSDVCPSSVSTEKLGELAFLFQGTPSILERCRRGDKRGCPSSKRQRVNISVWPSDPSYRKPSALGLLVEQIPITHKSADSGVRQSVHKVARQKGVSSGRTYTSKYRGVHQTFPTRRWEAQFRRNGKPTSLGCFDHEEEAARAYDRMMVWCELHGQETRGINKQNGLKPGLTFLPLNFEYGEYENEFDGLRQITQDDLVKTLRRQGRMQASPNAISSGDTMLFLKRKH